MVRYSNIVPEGHGGQRLPHNGGPGRSSAHPLHPRRFGDGFRLLAALIGWSRSASATALLDPAALFIGEASCPPGCPVYNGTEVNGIGPVSLTITETGSGRPWTIRCCSFSLCPTTAAPSPYPVSPCLQVPERPAGRPSTRQRRQSGTAATT